jgi:YfiH family protein
VTQEQVAALAGLRIFRQAEWAHRFTGLVQGITARADSVDFTGSGSPGDPSPAGGGWDVLGRATGISRIARCRQVHGSRVVSLLELLPPGMSLVAEADALVTHRHDVLLAVTVADCVPVFMVDPERRLLGLAHAGWRGTAAGVVEATLSGMEQLGASPGSLFVHLGPSIGEECYEVGPEVPEALGIAAGSSPTCTVDLRAQIARRLEAAGVDRRRSTASTACTRCESSDFYSYRGGDRGRRMCAFLGWPTR